MELSISEVDLAELVQGSVSDLRRVVLDGHPVEVTANDQPTVPADPTATREIIFNLLSNAAKYSDEAAAIDVTIDVDAGSAVVGVRNHGTGVTPGDTERIFERFFQGDSGTSGAGLGLYISRGLARAHGGDITVRPAAEVGSEFRLRMPL